MLTIPEEDARALAIRAAIRGGHLDILRRQLRENPALASARIVDRRGVSRTLLHVAADWPGHYPNGPEAVEILIAAGADVNAPVLHRDPHASAETALHWAASSDDVGVLEALIDGGADIEAPGAVFTGGTPMSDAVVFAQWRAARRLVDCGAVTLLWQAAALGLLDRVRDECAKDPPPGRQQITNAFWHACRAGQRSTAEFLLDRGADPDWIGHDHKTPRDVAKESGDADLIRWLRTRDPWPPIAASGS